MEDCDGVALAHALFNSLGCGDRQGVLGTVTQDAVVWHNYDNREKRFADRVDNLIRAFEITDGFHYAERRYQPLAGGALLQHRLRGTVAGGESFDAPIIVRAYVDKGRLARFEEYFDQQTLAPLYNAMRS